MGIIDEGKSIIESFSSTKADYAAVDAHKKKIQELTEEYDRLIKKQQELKASGEDVADELAQIDDALETNKQELAQETEEYSKSGKEAERNFGSNLADALGKFAKKGLDLVKKAWEKVVDVVRKAIAANTEYFQSLNSIVGINGKVGELGATLQSVASGVVGKRGLADFFGKTGDIMAGADAMKSQAKYARDLIAAYGSVDVAAQKYRNIQLLSVEDQKVALKLAEKQAKAVEGSSAGQVQAAKTQLTEAMNSIGASILYSVKPIIEFISQVAQAFKEVSGLQTLDDQTAAVANLEDMTEEQRKEAERVQKELDEIERLQATGFTSSLDEVHEVGAAYVDAKDQASEEAAAVEDASDRKSAAIQGVVEVMQSLFEIVVSVGECFANIFVTIGPGLALVAKLIGNVVGKVVDWLDSLHLLGPVLIGIVGILAAVTAAVAAYAIAVAIAKVAEGGISAPLIAALITAGVAMVGVAVGGSLAFAGSFGGGSSTGNSYSGVTQSVEKTQTRIYMDGKDVTDELASEAYYNEEVNIT